MAKSEEEEWVTNVYLSAIQDTETRNLAWRMALAMGRMTVSLNLRPGHRQKYLKSAWSPAR